MAANWYTDPMPAGWQAKWDPGQNRYFFIDHSTKKTSWVDPRSPEGRHQVTAPPRPQNTNHYGGGGGAIPMKPVGVFCLKCHTNKVASRGQVCVSCTAQITQLKCVKCHRNQVKKIGDACTQCMLKRLLEVETSFTREDSPAREEESSGLFVRADPGLVKKLNESFPDAFDSHIRAALENNNNDENKANRELEKRGYEKVSQQQMKVKKLMEKLKPKYPECPDEILQTTIISCDCNGISTTRKLKELGFLTNEEKKDKEDQEREAKKKRVAAERAIRKNFPNVSFDLITMALESTKYDEKKASDLLKSMTSPNSGKTSAKPETPAATPAATSAAATASKAAAAAAAAGKGKQPAKAVLLVQLPVTTPPAAKKSQVKPAVTKATSQKEAQQKAARSKSKKDVKSNNTKKVHYVSKLAHGPDLTLAKGHQDSILLKGYCDVMGPNLDLVRGTTCSAAGTQGAFGPDKSLVHGPVRRNAISV